jgi:hypothetical protein
MTRRPARADNPARTVLAAGLPTHWTPPQALAVFECLHTLREALWAIYGIDAQIAWQEQLRSAQDHGWSGPDFDPDAPF